jgi:hypothetical protein
MSGGPNAPEPKGWRRILLGGGGILAFLAALWAFAQTEAGNEIVGDIYRLVKQQFVSDAPLTFEAGLSIAQCASGSIEGDLAAARERGRYDYPNGAERVRICDDVAAMSVAPDEFPEKLVSLYPGCFYGVPRPPPAIRAWTSVKSLFVTPSPVLLEPGAHPKLFVLLGSPAVCRAPVVANSDVKTRSNFNPLLCLGDKGRKPWHEPLTGADVSTDPRECTNDELRRLKWMK